MSNAINSVSNNSAIRSVSALPESSDGYYEQVTSLQGDINDIYNEMLLNDYDKSDLQSDINTQVSEQNTNIDEAQATAMKYINEGFENEQEMSDLKYEQTNDNIDNFEALLIAYANAECDDGEEAAAYAALATLLCDFMRYASETQQLKEQQEQEKKQMAVEMVMNGIDKFQEKRTEKANEIPNEFETATKDRLASETEANGGQVVSSSGAQITMDGSTNQDLYIEGSGNTIVINGDYQGDIVLAPDATDNTIIINGNYGAEGDLSMGGKNNTVEVNGDNAANMVIGGDGNTVKTSDDVTGNVAFGGEGNSVQYGDSFTGNITQNSSESNSVKLLEIEEIEGQNNNLKTELDSLQNQVEDAEVNADKAKTIEDEQENQEAQPAVDENGMPLAGSPVAA